MRDNPPLLLANTIGRLTFRLWWLGSYISLLITILHYSEGFINQFFTNFSNSVSLLQQVCRAGPKIRWSTFWSQILPCPVLASPSSAVGWAQIEKRQKLFSSEWLYSLGINSQQVCVYLTTTKTHKCYDGQLQCSPLSLVEERRGLALIGREIHSEATPPAFLCH